MCHKPKHLALQSSCLCLLKDIPVWKLQWGELGRMPPCVCRTHQALLIHILWFDSSVLAAVKKHMLPDPIHLADQVQILHSKSYIKISNIFQTIFFSFISVLGEHTKIWSQFQLEGPLKKDKLQVLLNCKEQKD